MDNEFFRKLSAEDEVVFREWARDNFDPDKQPEEVWHPVVRDEWAKLMRENGR